MFSLLTCDPHFPTRAAVRLLARQALPACAVAEARDARELLALLDSGRSYDLLVLEPALPVQGGAALVSRARERRPDVPLLVLSADERPWAVASALEAGAAGYLFKSGPEQALFHALRDAMARCSGLPAAAIAGPARARPALGLSPRQADVLRCLMRGFTGKPIARALGISEGTVKSHTVAVFHALNVNSRTQAVVEAYRRGVVPES